MSRYPIIEARSLVEREAVVRALHAFGCDRRSDVETRVRNVNLVSEGPLYIAMAAGRVIFIFCTYADATYGGPYTRVNSLGHMLDYIRLHKLAPTRPPHA